LVIIPPHPGSSSRLGWFAAIAQPGLRARRIFSARSLFYPLPQILPNYRSINFCNISGGPPGMSPLCRVAAEQK
jgi:hypothetical protein